MRAMIWLAVWVASLVLAFFVGRGQESPSPELLSPAPADMAAAARAALGEGSPLARMGQSAQMLEHLDAQNLEPVLDVYEMMLSGLGECDLRLFVDAWSDFDPRGAFDHTMSWEYSNKRVVGSDAAIRGWAIRNPIEARAAVPESSRKIRVFRVGSSTISWWVGLIPVNPVWTTTPRERNRENRER